LKRGSRVRLLIDATKETPERHKTVSTERAKRTEIQFLRRQRTDPIWLDTRQVPARQHGIDFERQSNEHCLARQPRNRYPA
jgi:hypothetical protein